MIIIFFASLKMDTLMNELKYHVISYIDECSIIKLCLITKGWLKWGVTFYEPLTPCIPKYINNEWRFKTLLITPEVKKEELSLITINSINTVIDKRNINISFSSYNMVTYNCDHIWSFIPKSVNTLILEWGVVCRSLRSSSVNTFEIPSHVKKLHIIKGDNVQSQFLIDHVKITIESSENNKNRLTLICKHKLDELTSDYA